MNFVKKKLIIPLIISIVVSIIIICLSGTRPFELLELKTLDLRFVNRFIHPEINEDIIIIAIDDESLEKNKEPLVFWGGDFGTVISKLSDYSKVIGLDYIQKISLEDYKTENDQTFAASLLKGKTVILTYINENGDPELPPPQLLNSVVWGENTGESSSIKYDRLGAGNLYQDVDAFYRFQPLLLETRENLTFASFAFAISSRYGGQTLQGLEEKGDKLILGEKSIPLSDQKEKYIYINFAGPAKTFPMVSFNEVLEKAKENDDDYFQNNFNGKIVLIGITSMGAQDFVLTPYNVLLLNPEMMTGIEFHANTINTLTCGNYIYKLSTIWVIVLIFVFSIFTAFICSFFDLTKSTIISGALLVSYIFFATILFNTSNLWVEIVPPAFTILFCYGFTSIYNYLLMDKEKKQINLMFERFVSTPVVKKMLANPEQFKLGGQKKEVTILFSDINDFTTISEKTPPEDLIGLLNSYLTCMTDIILESEGTLNQFVGDEIMVIYGAPLDVKGHAEKAVRAAVAMLKKLDQLREEGEMDIKVKIGIHTGEAILGNVGSRKRMQYTGVGDMVNFTSRIEGLNKEFGTALLISDATYERVKDLTIEGLKFKPMEPRSVKGKTGTHQTYEVCYKE